MEHTIDGLHGHILSHGDYSYYSVDALIPDDLLDDLAAQLARAPYATITKVFDRTPERGGPFDMDIDGLQIECVPIFGERWADEIRSAPSAVPVLRISVSRSWDGRGGDPEETEALANPRLVEGDEIDSPYWLGRRPGLCRVAWQAWESSYTLRVSLEVAGEDFARVRKVFSEQFAQLVADPASAVIRVWVRRGLAPWGGNADSAQAVGLPSWWADREENAGLRGPLSEAFARALADAGMHL